jgi:hypothetical protein
MSRSRFHSITSALVAVAASACGCDGGDSCGPGTAAADGLGLAGTGVDVRYAGLVASANNDCPEPGAPAGVVSLTISGTQSGAAFPLTLCIPRPDKLGTVPAALGTDVRLVDVEADIGGGCTLSLASTAAPTGTVRASGVCGDGTDPAGFALIFDGVVPMKRTCGAAVEVLDLALSGTVKFCAAP